MILEAQQIYESLRDAEWDMSIIHDDLKRPGKSVAIRAVISDNTKSIEAIYFLSPEETIKHWNQANGNHNGFPIFKIGGALGKLLPVAEFNTWSDEKSGEKRQKIQESWLSNFFPTKVNESIGDTFKQVLKVRLEALQILSGTPANRFLQLLKVFSEVDDITYSKWLHDIITLLRYMVHQDDQYSPLAEKLLFPLLFAEGDKSKVTIIWDLKGAGLSGSSAASPSNFSHINDALLATAKQSTTQSSDSTVCSLTGIKGNLEEDKFPEPTLPVIGKSFLYARNKDTPSFSRHNISGPNAFPLDHNHGSKLAAAISALTSPSREGKTWSKVNASNSTKPDLLLVFQSSLADQEFAAALGTNQHQLGEAGFEEISRRVTERTKGRAKDQLRGKLFIAVLRAVDKANRKVIFHENLSVESLEISARLWQDACRAFPCLKLPIPLEKSKPAPLMPPPVLSPGSLPALTKTFHFIGGDSSDSPGGITFPDAIRLLFTMQTPDSKLVRRCLSTAIRRIGPLLQRTSSIKYRSPSDLKKMNSDQKWNILKAQSLLSILIISSNRTPKIVMNSIAYQLGQLCAAYDLIHAGYCHQERGGDLPPKLLGNTCFQSANRNPIAALSQLSQRAAPHLAWVKRARKIESKDKLTEGEWAVIRARTASNDIRSNSDKIHQALLNDNVPVDDLFRAELLLGYLAGFPKKDTHESETTNTTKD